MPKRISTITWNTMSPDISSLSFFSRTRDDPFISPSQVPSSQTRMRMKQALRKFSEAALDKWWKEKTKHCLFALITSNYIFSYFPNYLDKRKRNWCLPVISVPVHTPTLKEWQRNYWNVPECTQNVCNSFSSVPGGLPRSNACFGQKKPALIIIVLWKTTIFNIDYLNITLLNHENLRTTKY